MTLRRLRVGELRCIEAAELELDPGRNFIYGPNGSGKTSLLEACHLLGRGRSFRTRRNAQLVRHGRNGFTVFAELERAGGPQRVGVRFEQGRLAIRIDGREAAGTGALSRALSVHVIDPGAHALVDGGPGDRRRFLDWGVFHVEQGYLERWRAYRRVLSQRNAALRQGAGGRSLDVWSHALAEAAAGVDADRRAYVGTLRPIVESLGRTLLGRAIELRYRPGWNEDTGFAEALESGQARDRKHGMTRDGPHRAEIDIRIDEAPARDNASRGQQKLLAAALVLGQVVLDGRRGGHRALLLVDDPASELDKGAYERLAGVLTELPVQLVLTGIEAPAEALFGVGRTFHVEQGRVNRVYTGTV